MIALALAMVQAAGTVSPVPPPPDQPLDTAFACSLSDAAGAAAGRLSGQVRTLSGSAAQDRAFDISFAFSGSDLPGLASSEDEEILAGRAGIGFWLTDERDRRRILTYRFQLTSAASTTAAVTIERSERPVGAFAARGHVFVATGICALSPTGSTS